MSVTHALLRAGSILLALTAATAAQATGDGYAARDGSGHPINLRGHTLAGSAALNNQDVLPAQALTDWLGNPIGAANPMRVAPGIAPASLTDHGGTIAAAGTAQAVMGANAMRAGGWIIADPNDTGTLYVSYTGASNTTPGAGKQCVLQAGGVCPLTIAGRVVQSAVSIAGTVQGDAYEAVEVQ